MESSCAAFDFDVAGNCALNAQYWLHGPCVALRRILRGHFNIVGAWRLVFKIGHYFGLSPVDETAPDCVEMERRWGYRCEVVRRSSGWS